MDRLQSLSGLAALILILPGTAGATIVTRCGGSSGTAYVFPSPLLRNDKPGWRPEAVSKGGIQLIIDGRDVDVIYTDGSGGTKSAKGDGFRIIPVPQSDSTRRVILGLHPDTAVIEHWVFDLDEKGKGVVIWGTIRGGTMFPKSSLMKADCVGP